MKGHLSLRLSCICSVAQSTQDNAVDCNVHMQFVGPVRAASDVVESVFGAKQCVETHRLDSVIHVKRSHFIIIIIITNIATAITTSDLAQILFCYT